MEIINIPAYSYTSRKLRSTTTTTVPACDVSHYFVLFTFKNTHSFKIPTPPPPTQKKVLCGRYSFYPLILFKETLPCHFVAMNAKLMMQYIEFDYNIAVVSY